MGNGLVLASVTALLKHLLENELIERGAAASVGGEIIVSALAPDRVATGADERPQLNLFLWQITPNTGLRGVGQSGQGASDERALSLDLYYLLSANGAQDLQAELLLGYAVQVFHELTLKRGMLQRTLAALASSDGIAGIPASIARAIANLGQQLEQIAVAPQFLSMEEMTKIWSATQAHYRPSVVYKVSLVGIGD